MHYLVFRVLTLVISLLALAHCVRADCVDGEDNVINVENLGSRVTGYICSMFSSI